MDLMDYRRKIIANSPHLKSASGDIVSFSDGADLPLKSLNVDIEPVQSGSGDPSPTNERPISGWSAVTIKNGNTISATISFGQTVYGGTLNPLTGVLTVDKAAVDLGSLTWSKSSSGTGRFYTSNGAIPQYGFGRIFSLCSRYADGGYANGSDYYGSDGQIRYWYRGQSATPRELYVVDTTLASATAAEFKSAMSGVLWVCGLATPFEIQLTPHQIRSLYGNNTIFADAGNISLEYWAHQ